MSEKKNTLSISKHKPFFVALLLFFFFSSFSQTNIFNDKPLTLDIKGGVNMPSGDFKDYAKNGFEAGLMLNKIVYKNLGIGVSANYNHFNLKENLGSSDETWSTVSLAVGPQYTLPLRMFFVKLYGHVGMSLIKTPEITKDAENIPEYFDKYDKDFFQTFRMESESSTGFHADVGIKLGVHLSKRLSVFVGSAYSTSLNSPVKYNLRDISKAFHPSGEVNTDMIKETPFEEKKLALSSYKVNAGITINLGKVSSTRPAQDHNSTRSNRPSPIAWVIDTSGNDTVPTPVYAQDYNSSRSNKPSPIASERDGIDNDSLTRPAQDHNSSRSNRPSPIAWVIDTSGNDTVPTPVYAQDYNSSRSNKPRPIASERDGIDNDTLTRPAQDHNSTRSNRPSPIAWVIDTGGNDTVPTLVYAQDYNSSRSNKPSPIASERDGIDNDTLTRPAQDHNSSRSNRPSPIAWVIDTSGNDTVPTPVYAQDYNSSRSNKPSPIASERDGVVNDTLTRPAQDHNSTRSNRPSPIAWVIDTNGSDTVPTPVYAQDYNSSRSNKPSKIRIADDINDINNKENQVIIIGKLISIDLKNRSFELIDKNNQKISGQFLPNTTNKEIEKLRHNYLNKKANIHVKINRTLLETGKEVVSYKL